MLEFILNLIKLETKGVDFELNTLRVGLNIFYL